jgi:uncharacterized cupin superfamily protein
MAATWQRLGDAAGAKNVGVNRLRIEPGMLPTPPHSHGRSEELYYVLGGSGLAWQDEKIYEVRPGDCVVQVADNHEHTFRAGAEGLELLAFGTRHPVEYGWLPRSNALRLGYPWVEGRTDNPWEIEAEVGDLEFAEPGERPANVVNVDEVEADEDDDKELAGSAGSVHSGLNYNRRAPGRSSSPPHNHSEEEEVFVILEGSGTLELWPAPIMLERGLADREDHEVHAGHVIARPPGSRVGHRLVAGPEGMTYLAYGTRKPNDICFYPRSNKISFRGVGVIARIEHVAYWDGEPRD